MIRWRYVVVAALLGLAIGVDFTSKFLSVVSDGVLIGLAIYIIWPIIKPSKK